MGGIKKKLQRLFGGGKKRERRDGNLSEFDPRNEGLGGIGVTGLGMTESGTDLGDWGNGAILDELQPPPVPERKDRPQLTNGRRDNPTGIRGRGELTTARRDNPILGGHRRTTTTDEDTSIESSGEETSLESSGSTSESSTSSGSSSIESSGSYDDPDDFEYDYAREDDDDLSTLPTLGLVSQKQGIPEPPPLPPKRGKYDKVAKLGETYKGEDVQGTWRDEKFKGTGQSRTEYLRTESEREKRRVGVDDQGRLRKNGELLTTGKVDKDGQRTGGIDLFAMDTEGDILSSNDVEEFARVREEVKPVLDKEARGLGKDSWDDLTKEEKLAILDSGRVRLPYFHHSSFFAGEDVGGAGMLRVIDGILKLVTPDSGHYKPEIEQTMNTLTELKEQGANLDHARVGVHERDKNGNIKLEDPDNPYSANMEYFHPNELFESGGDEKTLMGKKGFLHDIEEISEKSKVDDDDDTPDVKEMLWRARGKKDAPVREEEVKEEGPEEFVGRQSGKAGSKPQGEKKYDELAPLGDKYRDEHHNARWRSPDDWNKPVYDSDTRSRTVALTDEGRDKRRLHVGEDGLLYNSEGLLMDTIDSGGLIREDMDEGAFIFAMSDTGDILTTDAYQENIDLQKKARQGRTSEERDKQYFHHSSFFGGRDLAGAGGLRVRDGKLVTLTPNSGHHLSGNEQSLNVFEEMLDRGVDITDLKVDYLTKHKAEPGERQLGRRRMQYLAGGAVHQALGSEEDKERARNEGKAEPTREKALQRLDQQVDLLDEIKHVRYLAGSDENTRALEHQMMKYMLDGAFEPEIVKYVEEQGLEVVDIDHTLPFIQITNPNVSPSRMREISNPKTRGGFEEDQQKHESSLGKLRSDTKKARKEGTDWRDVGRLPEWARNDKHEEMAKQDEIDRKRDQKKREKKERRKREEEERKKKQTQSKPYGSVSPYGSINYDDVVEEKKENTSSPYPPVVYDDEVETKSAPYPPIDYEDEVETKSAPYPPVDYDVEEDPIRHEEDDDLDKDDDTESSDDDWEQDRPKVTVSYHYSD